MFDETERVELDPGARERLLRVVQACPPGSNGETIAYWLGKVTPVVGNFASATIDEFFAEQIDVLARPYSSEDISFLSGLETEYWRAQSGLEYVVGALLSAEQRESLQNHAGELLNSKEK
ncbi:hypothetical protein [Streptomyces sp. NPDC058572]|uniref:hypothetical protein n=1 Tax=Streptomyces sp. NPDC058572 TaxID=3346546 RepID=UPI00364B22E5